MAGIVIIRDEFIEGTDLQPTARVQLLDGTNVLQASLSSIDLNVYDEGSNTPTTALLTSNPTIANVIFDTLQLDATWGEDDIGFNFQDTILASALTTTGGHTYRVEYKLNPSSGGPIPILAFFQCVPLRSA